MRRFWMVLAVSVMVGMGGWGQNSGARTGSAARPASTASKPATAAAKPATAAAPQGVVLSPASLDTDGLNYADDIARIYVGDFEHVRLKRDGPEIGLLVGGYMNAFSERCDQSLPKNKVEIMQSECAQEQWRVNGYGREVPGSRYCVSYQSVGTGRYADPEVYALNAHTDAAMASNTMGDMMTGLKRGDPSSGMRKVTDIAAYAGPDMATLIRSNGCVSAAMVRFQANFLRFGEGKEPIRMPGRAAAVASAASATSTGPAKGQNFKRLINDLIAEESKAWMINRYQPGTVNTSNVMRDAQGRAAEVEAWYGYVGMEGHHTGTVRVTFKDGSPECLYFSDFPTSCRAPSPRVISAYERNQYAN
jgi:hypothetical protein